MRRRILYFLSPPSEMTTTMSSASDFSRYSKFASRLMKNWGPTLAVYMVGLTAIGLYVTDWKVTNEKIPYYGKKFDEESNL